MNITKANLYELHLEIERKRRMADIVSSPELKRSYIDERMAMQEALGILLGHDLLTETLDLLRDTAREVEAQNNEVVGR